MKKKKTSIQSKTLLFLLSYSIVIILLLWISIFFMMDIYYKKDQIKKMDNIVSTIKNNEYENDTLRELSFQNDVCILYVKDNKINSYNTKMNGCILNINNPNIKKDIEYFILSGNDFDSKQFENEEQKVNALLYSTKTSDGYAFIYTNLKDISDFTLLIKKIMVYIVVVSIAVAIITSVILANKITDPIKKINNKAKRLGLGNYNIKFEESDIKEIDELSKTLTEAEREMAKTDELRRDLMANVSHDLKTPLTMIKAYAEMIRDISYKDKNKMDEHLSIIEDEADRLTLLVNDILDLSKMQSNADTLNIEKFDLVLMIKEIVKKYEIIKETEAYKINIDTPDKVLIEADKKKIYQVIYNLVNNAINYTGDDKIVTIKVTKDKKEYLVEIIDTGKGIKEEEIPFIWDKYYKSEKKHQRNVVSTGVGLSIVKQVLELHNYKYGVKSKINEGSTFYFYIK